MKITSKVIESDQWVEDNNIQKEEVLAFKIGAAPPSKVGYSCFLLKMSCVLAKRWKRQPQRLHWSKGETEQIFNFPSFGYKMFL